MSGQMALGDLRCSFCGRQQSEVRRLVAGPPDLFICDSCVRSCLELVRQARPLLELEGDCHCSFCGQDRAAVRTLVRGPGAYICNECLELSRDMVAEGDL